jgi:hypothetical protein
MLVEKLDAKSAEVAPGWPERRSQMAGDDSALFDIVRNIGDPWDATGERETVAVYGREPATPQPLPAWPGPDGFAAGDGSAWRQVFADPAARPYEEVDGFLFMIEVAVEPKVREAFDDWYTTRHVPDVRSAGLVAARRYESLDAEARFLATYEMESPAVLSSDELARVRGFESFTEHVISIDRFVLHPAGQS